MRGTRKDYSINANAMPTEKKVLGVGGGLGKPHLQGENAGKPTVARLRTDFSRFICSPMNANAMPTLYQKNTNQCQRYTKRIPINANAMPTKKGSGLGNLSPLRLQFWWTPIRLEASSTNRGCKCWVTMYGMMTSG